MEIHFGIKKIEMTFDCQHRTTIELYSNIIRGKWSLMTNNDKFWKKLFLKHKNFMRTSVGWTMEFSLSAGLQLMIQHTSD